MWRGQGLGQAAKAGSNGLDGQAQDPGREGGCSHRNDEHRPVRTEAPDDDNDANGQKSYYQGRDIQGWQGVPERQELGNEGPGFLVESEPQQFLELAREDDDGNASREAHGHRIGNELDKGSKPQEPDRQQDQAAEHGRKKEPINSMLFDSCRHQHDEGPCRPADLKPASPQCRDDEASDNGCVKAPVGGHT